MPVRHQVIDTDTLEHLSNVYFGTPDRWRDIADYNSLVYPYLSQDSNDRYKGYAAGFIRVTRETSRQPLTIQKYWTVNTRKSIMSGSVKSFYVVNDVTIPPGDFEAFVYVRAFIPGLQGNASEGTLTELGDEFLKNSVVVNITNDAPITGGMEGFVRVTGDYIFIPDADDTQLLTDYGTTFSYEQARYFYGDDLKLDENDDLVIGTSSEDLSTINFIENVKQAVNRRFSTEQGEVLSDFSFGNRIAEIIGDNKLAYEAKQRLIRLAVLECLSYEDRVSDPVINTIEVVPEELSCYVDVTVKVVQLGSDIRFDSLRIGGIA